jgi:hypothetical protein
LAIAFAVTPIAVAPFDVADSLQLPAETGASLFRLDASVTFIPIEARQFGAK